eukprot:m.12722 g.12722  ORF g.12722 m.12722 type:complete len:446 (-) comp4722_c0_seq1:151-1488(-)
MRVTISPCSVLYLFTLFFSSQCQTPTPFSELVTKELKAALEEMAIKNKMGIWIAFKNKTEDFTLSLGTSDGGKTPAAEHDIIPVGSLAKPFTATSIFLLIEQGVFGLDDAFQPLVDPYLTKYNGTTLQKLGWGPEISRVTLRMLLHMLSGITTYNDTLIHELTDQDPHYDISPYDYLALNSKKMYCDPGSTCTKEVYSSINYLFLGLVLAAHYDVPWDGLNQLSISVPPARRKDYPGIDFFLHGECSTYKQVTHYYDAQCINTTTKATKFEDLYNESCLNGFAFGNIGANARSAARFFYDLLGPTPQIVSQKSRLEMMKFGDNYLWDGQGITYGLGIWHTDRLSMYNYSVNTSFPGIEPYLSYVGHAGDDYGTVSRQGWHDKLQFSFSVIINRQRGDFPYVNTDMHVVYCLFWKTLFRILLSNQVPAITKAFPCTPQHGKSPACH